ncbi:MAG: restriction endonuclease subunit S [Anaerolineales bacterium]|nr:restriction endonuclease subunit S [Anaerolineales bacterium]
MKAYPAYKDSKATWLSNIPTHWNVVKIKYVANIETGNTPPKADEENYADGLYIWVKPDELMGLTPIYDSKEKLSEKGKIFSRVVPKGSILVCCIGTIGKYGIAGVDLSTNQQINAVTFNDMYSQEFGKYVMAAAEEEHIRQSFSVVVSILSKSRQSNIKVPVPTLTEQQAIADFLDRKTSQIDKLIEKKQRQIELLQEQRTALINQAVTKGLDPTVQMKDSGIEWLGEIPAHWVILKLKYVSNLQTGITLGKSYIDQETVLRPYLRVANVQDGYLDLDDIKLIELLPNDLSRYALHVGDVVLTEGGDFDKLGRGYVWEGQIDGCLHQNHIFAVRPNQKRLNSYYLAFLMSSQHGKNYFTSTSKQTTNLATTNSTQLKNFALMLPTIDEQEQIIHYINDETGKIDDAIAKVSREIELLQEYRTALISDAVTGKIDVR